MLYNRRCAVARLKEGRIVSSRSKIITVIIIFALTVYAGINLYNFWEHHVDVLEELQETRQEIAEMQQKIADLEHMLANIDDPDVMRRIAEEMLGLVSPDEFVITDGSGIQLDD
jgi:cell division protein FtsB